MPNVQLNLIDFSNDKNKDKKQGLKIESLPMVRITPDNKDNNAIQIEESSKQFSKIQISNISSLN